MSLQRELIVKILKTSYFNFFIKDKLQRRSPELQGDKEGVLEQFN